MMVTKIDRVRVRCSDFKAIFSLILNPNTTKQLWQGASIQLAVIQTYYDFNSLFRNNPLYYSLARLQAEF